MNLKSDNIYILEEMLDKNGLGYMLNLLIDVCYEKQEHVLSNWQDEGLAQMWAIRANHLSVCILSIEASE